MEPGELRQSLCGFACALEPFDDQLRTLALEVLGAEAWQQLWCMHRDALESAAGDGLRQQVRQQLASESSADAVWDRSFGLCLELLHGGRSHPAIAAASVGLRFAAQGMDARWSVSLPAAVGLRFDRFRLPSVRRMAVSATPGRVALELTGGEASTARLVFERRGGDWHAATDGTALTERPAIALGGRRIELVLADSETAEGAPSGVASAKGFAVAGYAAAIGRAYALLEAHAPAFAVWVSRVLRGLGPVVGAPGRMLSSTDRHWPGVITLSSPAADAAIAEMLVHECAHQYFHIARLLGPVDDGSDERLYFSPVKRMGRPIRRILLAYHAFANVALMNQHLLAAGADADGYCARNRRELAPQLETMARALDETRALTDVGRGLFLPLAARLTQAVAA